MKKVLVSASAAITPTIIGWAGGMEFERGPGPGLCLAVGVFAAFFVITFPGWEE